MVTIEELTPAHYGPVAEWLARPETNRWLTSDWRDREITPSVIAITCRNKRNRLFLVLMDGRPAGLVALAELDQSDSIAMIWYLLGDLNLATRGVMSAAVRSLCRKAFEELGLAVVYAWVMENNLPSRKLLNRTGFQLCGRMRNAAPSGDCRVARLYFDLTPADLQVPQEC